MCLSEDGQNNKQKPLNQRKEEESNTKSKMKTTMKQKTLFKPLLLEFAWEVCNKVGGIYTVIQSKVPFIQEYWQDQYCLIGPVLQDHLPAEFQLEARYDKTDIFSKLVKSLNDKGVEAYYGDWLIPGKPKVILLGLQKEIKQINKVKKHYSSHHGIPFNADPLVDRVMAFANASNHLLKHFKKIVPKNSPVIAHFHEWMSAAPILEIKRLKLNYSTVFTTHATALGRYMAGNESDFYIKLPQIEWSSQAKHYNIEPQAYIERGAAQNATVLTTVSNITDQECEYLLGRKSDVIVPNGLNVERFEALHEFQNLHLKYKQKINEFVMSHFFSSYTFDFNDTLYFFTSGRYEYVNKGYDLTLEALYRLNAKMKAAKINKTVVMFFITKRPFQLINPLVMELRSLIEELKQTSESIKDQIGDKLFYAAVQQADNQLPDLNEMVDDFWKFRFRKTLQSLKTKYNSLPLVVTHNLLDDLNDDILKSLRQNECYNQPSNPVKIIYHPDFVDSTNPLFKLDYSEFVRGCHLGIFPSYYEPWGYTPVECIVRGVPTISSDLSGFGDYAKKHVEEVRQNDSGVFILSRRNRTFDESAEQLANQLLSFVQQDRRERIAQRNRVERVSDKFSWRSLGHFYIKAYQKAMEEE